MKLMRLGVTPALDNEYVDCLIHETLVKDPEGIHQSDHQQERQYIQE